MEVKMKTKPLLAAALVAAALPAAAFAQPATESHSVAVPYRDLDLASDAGRHSLEARIRIAVREACGRMVSGTLSEATVVRRCRRQSAAVAASQARLAIARATISGAALAAQ
jgi:UrcA family protein